MVRHTGEDFINEESITVASVLSFQSPSVNRAEFDAPETYRLATDCHATFSEKILYITMAQIESIVEPDCIGNDIGWESAAFVCIDSLMIPILAFNLAIPSYTSFAAHTQITLSR
ncbi:MAG: hypothetical protein ACJARI_003479 [Bacteroidia bacterium]|jgi:hypothetical protein